MERPAKYRSFTRSAEAGSSAASFPGHRPTRGGRRPAGAIVPRLVEVHATPVAPVLRALLAAGAVDQDPPHRLGRGGEEVAPAVPACSAARVHQPQVGLVDQGRGLEGLPGLLAGQPLGGQLAQLVVDQRQELLGRLGVALLDRREDAGHVAHGNRSQAGPSRGDP